MSFEKTIELKGYSNIMRTLPYVSTLVKFSYVLRDNTLSPENCLNKYFQQCTNGCIRENNKDYDINDKSIRKAQIAINGIEIMIYSTLIKSTSYQGLLGMKNPELLANYLLREWVELMDDVDPDLLNVS